MSDMSNPYQSPAADVSAVRPMLAPGGISEKALFYLKAASPWMRFLGIIGFIGSGFLVLFGLLIVTLPAIFLRMMDIPITEADVSYQGAIGIMGTLGGLIYVLSAVLLFFPARWLYRTGAKFRAYARTGSDLDLEEAFRSTRSFWKFLGILTIVWLAFLPVVIVITTVAAIGNAFR